jgi:hypothetical protein
MLVIPLCLVKDGQRHSSCLATHAIDIQTELLKFGWVTLRKMLHPDHHFLFVTYTGPCQ